MIAATNRPDRLDPALLRPGRLDRLVEVPVPDETARRAIFRVHTRDRPVEAVDYDRLAAQTEGYTGSDIEAVVREASLLALERVLDGERNVDPREVDGLTVGPAEFDRALRRVGPSLTDETLANYEAVVEDVVSRTPD